jgi:hypothetical protein
MIEISDRARELVWSAESALTGVFQRTDAIEMANRSAYWKRSGRSE